MLGCEPARNASSGEWQTAQPGREDSLLVDTPEDIRQTFLDSVYGGSRGFSREQCSRNCVTREIVHLRGYVHGPSVAPADGERVDLLGHEGGVFAQASAGEGRLQAASLSPMGAVGARGKTVPQRIPDPFDDGSALVVSAVMQENFLDEFRPADYDGRLCTQPYLH